MEGDARNPFKERRRECKQKIVTLRDEENFGGQISEIFLHLLRFLSSALAFRTSAASGRYLSFVALLQVLSATKLR